MDEEAKPDLGGFADVATRFLLQATVKKNKKKKRTSPALWTVNTRNYYVQYQMTIV